MLAMMKLLLIVFLVHALLALTSICCAAPTSLGAPPPWERLKAYDSSVTGDDFTALLDLIYAPSVMHSDFFLLTKEQVRIPKQIEKREYFHLKLAQNGEVSISPRFWRTRDEIVEARVAGDKPLAGLRVILDPGHIGGEWAEMENRYFQLGNDTPVAEGDLTLRLAKLVKKRLESLGVEVALLRGSSEPITLKRSDDFMPLAHRLLLEREGQSALMQQLGDNPNRVRELADVLFYRVSEIRSRAKVVNDVIKPDIVLALHFNAASWPPGPKLRLTHEDHFHVLVNGAYSREELAYDDVRFEMLLRLLQRTSDEEIKLANALAKSLAKETDLPPFKYRGDNATRVNDNPYVWARNLLANRLYECPVVYLEPYCMNGKQSYPRIQVGDYEGLKKFNGRMRKSIFREYSDGIVEGLLNYYTE